MFTYTFIIQATYSSATIGREIIAPSFSFDSLPFMSRKIPSEKVEVVTWSKYQKIPESI